MVDVVIKKSVCNRSTCCSNDSRNLNNNETGLKAIQSKNVKTSNTQNQPNYSTTLYQQSKTMTLHF